MSRRRAITHTRAALTAALVVVLLGLGQAIALAQVPRVVTGVSLSTDGEPTGARLRIVNTFPGDTRSVGIFLEGGYTPAVDLIALDLTDLVDLENTCLRPEIRAGDDCSDPEGELSDFLLVSSTAGWERVVAGERGCDADPDADTTGPIVLKELIDIGQLHIERPPGDGHIMCGILTLHFSAAPDANIAQSDSATFTMSTIFRWDPDRVPDEFWTGGAPGSGGGPTTPPVDPDGPVDEEPDTPGTPPVTSPGPAPTVPVVVPSPDGSEGPVVPGPSEPGLPEFVIEPDDDEVAAGGGSRGGGGRLPYTGATVLGLLLFGAMSTTLGAFLLRVRRPARAAEVRP